MAASKRRVQVFTDGACLGNPGAGGWAALLGWGEVEKMLTGSERDSTNNRMELMAAIAGLEALTRPCTVDLTTDSQYVKRGVQEWMPRWRRNGWMTAAKKPVKNKDLWQRIDVALEPHDVTWHWVRGHSGHPQNERVDQAARHAAEAVGVGV